MKKIFGFDIDGVLYPWHKAVYEYLSETKELKPYQVFWQEIIDNKDNNDSMLWDNIVNIEVLYSMYSANTEDVNTLKELAKEFELVYISHRPKVTTLATFNWLRRYDFPYKENLILTDAPKDIAVRLYNCEYYVEDKSSILLSNLRNVTKLIAQRTLWNWDACETLPYVDSVSDIPKILKEIS